VEDGPHGEVLGKVLEAALGSRGHGQEVAGLEGSRSSLFLDRYQLSSGIGRPPSVMIG
jgi:hypothetical protein